MKINAIAKPEARPAQQVVFCRQGQSVETGSASLDALINHVISSGQFECQPEEVLPIVTAEQVCILVGAGGEGGSLTHRQIAVGMQTALKTKPLHPKHPVTVRLSEDTPTTVRAAVDGAKLGGYQWKKYLKPDEKLIHYDDFEIQMVTQHEDVVSTTAVIADGVNTARNLANDNADTVDSVWIERTIRSICEGHSQCEITVLNQPELEEAGMGLHLAVNRGSQNPPKLIIVKYQGGKADEPYPALIGKGLTYDTGGLNIKPTGSMEDMRMDMCGAATVIGTLQNAIQLKLQRNVLFVAACAENLVSSTSYKPGDVYRSYSGMTVEIGNTDAEGRLVLADANSYIARNYRPHSIINIATLTGAVVIALGYEYTGVMSSDSELAQSLLRASSFSDDRAWQLPIYDELKEHLKSERADLKNIGIKRTAGAISAGEFLRQFVHCESKDTRWAHLDIAGTAKPDHAHGYFDTQATGAGVRLLTHYLLGA